MGWLHQLLLEPGNLRWREYLTIRLPKEWKELEKEIKGLKSKPVAIGPDHIIKYTAKEKYKILHNFFFILREDMCDL